MWVDRVRDVLPTMVVTLHRWRRTSQGKKILFILGIGLIIVFINFICGISLSGNYPYGNVSIKSSTSVRKFQRSREEYKRWRLYEERLAIFSRLFEKQNRQSRRERQLCQQPHLDLKHDLNKNAYFHLPPLNCTGKSLFYLQNGAVRLNRTVLGGKELGKCSYFGVEWMSDDYFTYTESLEKTRDPYDLILRHDFIRIQCNYKLSEEKTNVRKENKILKNSVESPSGRHLLSKMQLGSFHGNRLEKMRQTESHTHRNLLQQIVRLSEDPSNSGVVERNDDDMKGESLKGRLKSARIRQQADLSQRSIENDSHSPVKAKRHLLDEDDSRPPNSDYRVHPQYYEDNFDYSYYVGGDAVSDFDQFLVQVVPREEVFKRIANVSVSRRRKSSGLNVLIFAMDSMSHLSYQRKLPLTYRYLKEELKATVLNGYNIVGDATTAALIPMLTGKTEMELPEARRDKDDSNFVDIYPLVWKKFEKAGYTTMFAEDEPSLSTFNLRLNGFQRVPTDHYMRPFWQALWESTIHSDSPRFCTGAKPNHQYLLEYLKDMFTKYEKVSKFVLGFSGELTHADNNPGEHIDADLHDFLVFLKEKGHLNNTALIVMGDHGARYSKVRYTVQGKLEERLPLMSIVLPEWFLNRHPHIRASLRHNSHSLTTPFDIHETFLDLLDLERLKEPNIFSKRGMSVLRDILENRTCESADIDVHWCACLQQIQVSFDDKFVVLAAKSAVDYINKLTEELRTSCVELKLKQVLVAQLVLPNEQVLKFRKSKDSDQREGNFSSSIDLDKAHYQVTFDTSPSDALYEVTVEIDFRNETYQPVLTPEISRLNLYGDQPKCIQAQHPSLRKYCYCKDFVNAVDEKNINTSAPVTIAHEAKQWSTERKMRIKKKRRTGGYR